MLLDIHQRKNSSKGIYLTGFGGVPFLEKEGILEYCGCFVDVSRVNSFVKSALGLSAELTYENPSNLDMEKLGGKVQKMGHTFAYRWITLSFFIKSPENGVEIAFLRDGRFRTSWCETDCNDFIVHGELASFLYFCETVGSRSECVTNTMKQLSQILEEITK